MPTHRFARPCVWALAALAAGLALAGCKDEIKDISSAKHLLAQQHKAWKNAREAFEADEPNLEFIRVVDMFLSGRTKRRVEKEYGGADRDEIIAKLDALNAAYQDRVISKVNIRSAKVVLRRGVTMDELREAFESLDADYRALEAMTSWE